MDTDGSFLAQPDRSAIRTQETLHLGQYPIPTTPTHVARRRRIYAYLRYRHRKLANFRHPLNRIRSFRSVKLEQH